MDPLDSPCDQCCQYRDDLAWILHLLGVKAVEAFRWKEVAARTLQELVRERGRYLELQEQLSQALGL